MVFFSADSFWVSFRFLSSFFNCPNCFLCSFESECLQLWRPLVWKELYSISLSLVQDEILLSCSEGRWSSSWWEFCSFLYFSFWISFSLLVRGFSDITGWTWGAVGSYSVVSYSNSLNSSSSGSSYRSSTSPLRFCSSSSATNFFNCFFFSFLSLFFF